MNRIFICSILALSLPTNYAYAQQQSVVEKQPTPVPRLNEQWKTYTSPNKDFIIDFPVEPKLDEFSNKDSITGIRPFGHLYSSYTDNLMFVIGFQDTGYKPGSAFGNSISSDFERKVKDAYRGVGWKIVSIKRLSNSMAEVEAWEKISRPKGYAHTISRTVVRNGQVYDLQCRSTFIGQKVDRNICRRFFTSFHVIGPQQ